MGECGGGGEVSEEGESGDDDDVGGKKSRRSSSSSPSSLTSSCKGLAANCAVAAAAVATRDEDPCKKGESESSLHWQSLVAQVILPRKDYRLFFPSCKLHLTFSTPSARWTVRMKASPSSLLPNAARPV